MSAADEPACEFSPFDFACMARALELAEQGCGRVEPNPMVGCVLTQGNTVVGEGWHTQYGGPHAEVGALTSAGELARDATAYVTLEPCSHFGKTPPCADALIAAGVRRVVAAMIDPFPQVAGQGLAKLRAAGIETASGLLAERARALNAPYCKLIERGRPWMIAKWAMTLDGRIATHTGDSQWISGEESRARVHELRGRVDAIMVGSGSAAADNPRLTARPAGPRTALRVVVDSQASLAPDSQLVRTARETPVLAAVGESAPAERRRVLEAAGVEAFVCAGATHAERLQALCSELGRRRLTNVLVEGGSRLLGSLFDLGELDEVWAFVAPTLVGGSTAPGPVGGMGLARLADARKLKGVTYEPLGRDVLMRGRIARVT